MFWHFLYLESFVIEFFKRRFHMYKIEQGEVKKLLKGL
jgi:hypothetical protein